MLMRRWMGLLVLAAWHVAPGAFAQDDEAVPRRRSNVDAEASHADAAPPPNAAGAYSVATRPVHLPEASFAEAFYGRGRHHVDGGLTAFYTRDPEGEQKQDRNTWRLSVYPSYTYFVRDRMGVGADLGLAWAGGNLSFVDGYRYAVGAHAMFGFPLAARTSWLLWPGISLRFSRDRLDKGVRLGPYLYAPFMFHPNARVALGVGPELGVLTFPSEDIGPRLQLLLRTTIAVSLGGRDSGRPSS